MYLFYAFISYILLKMLFMVSLVFLTLFHTRGLVQKFVHRRDPLIWPVIRANHRELANCGKGLQEVGPISKLTKSQLHEELSSLLPPAWVQDAGKPDSGLSGLQQQGLGQCNHNYCCSGHSGHSVVKAP